MASFSFAPLRDIPQTGLSEWEYSLLGGIKENLELLTGTRQSGVRAVMSASILVSPLGAQKMIQLSAKGDFVTINTYNVPLLADYQLLATDVQTLANDVYYTRAAFDSLVSQLKS